MRVMAYPLYGRAAPLQPSRQGKGWDFLCPYAFEAIWHGGLGTEDVEVRLVDGAPGPVDFAQSRRGQGLLTLHPGYQCRTEGEHVLLVRGPVNAPKDGVCPMESLLDTSVFPGTIVIDWQLTRAGQTIRFAAGEPFCTILPYPKAGLNDVAVEVIQPGGDVEDYDAVFRRMADSPAVQGVFKRLSAGPGEPLAAKRPRIGGHRTAKKAWAARFVNRSEAPGVSCICPTYGRVELLEEAIHAFLEQDYPGGKELIVLNDYDRQTLIYDHPEVQIVNLPRRLHSVAEKHKAAVSLAAHDLIFLWPDDDISLPHRLSYTVAHFERPAALFKADKAWLWNEGELSGPEPEAPHGGSCWRRDLFVRMHGYPHVGNRYGSEVEALCAAEGNGSVHLHPIAAADVYYIRRWQGTGSYHFSAMGADGEEHREVAAYVERQAARGEIPQGRIRLRPRWRTDYRALVRERLRAISGRPPAADAAEIPFPPPFHVIPPPRPLPAEQADRLFRGDHAARISVILPATNESVMLRRTVEQFAATLPADSEVIVIDNGSTDGCADFLAAEPRANVQLIRSPQPLGVAAARNRGLAQARGEIVVFADAHIDVPERWWEPIVCTLNQPQVGVVAPGIGVMGEPHHPASYGQRIAEPNLRVEWLPWKAAEPHPVPTLGGGFMAMRRDTLEQAGAFDDGMPQWGSEDLELCVRYWLLGYEVWVVPEVTVLHYFRKRRPYGVRWHLLTHNLLRVALLHFNQSRTARVASALRNYVRFGPALAHAVESDVWQRRAELASRRVHDDDWLFEKFKDSCHV
jgi:glycosyltransferase involved in cell wall biosynthesis